MSETSLPEPVPTPELTNCETKPNIDFSESNEQSDLWINRPQISPVAAQETTEQFIENSHHATTLKTSDKGDRKESRLKYVCARFYEVGYLGLVAGWICSFFTFPRSSIAPLVREPAPQS
jgi:hypothetical protein